MDKLKPCPFCGGEARVSNNKEYNSFLDEEAYVVAMCCSCGIRTPKFYYCPEQNERSIAEMTVAKRWNRRANNG